MNEKSISFQEAVTEALEEELARDPAVVIVGEDIRIASGTGPGLADLSEKFPGRIIVRMPLVEEMLCGIGLGMNLGGLKPVVQFNHSAFLALAFSELYQLATWRYRMTEKSGPGVVVRVGHIGYPQTGTELDAALFSSFLHLPNIWIAAPTFAYHAKGLLKSAIRANRPVLFIEDKVPWIYEQGGAIPDHEYTVQFPSAVVCKPGNDLTVISWQFSTLLATRAAEKLDEAGIGAEVISLQTLQPWDRETVIASAKKTNRVLIVEEDFLRGGIGAEISAQIHEALPQCRIKRLASKNMPHYYEPPHVKSTLPNESAIVEACMILAGTAHHNGTG